MALQNTKVQLISLSLAAVLTLAYLGNQRALLSHKTQTGGARYPASIGAINMSSSALEKLQLIEENDLAEEVAPKSARRSLASIGQPANDLENLRFGVLEGKYEFKMRGDNISEISLIENSSQRPTAIPNRVDFINKYASQFGAVSAPQRLSSVSKGEHLIETYRVKSKVGPDRIIEVTLGEANTLLVLKTADAPSLKLF
jgi:hypothetical protein